MNLKDEIRRITLDEYPEIELKSYRFVYAGDVPGKLDGEDIQAVNTAEAIAKFAEFHKDKIELKNKFGSFSFTIIRDK